MPFRLTLLLAHILVACTTGTESPSIEDDRLGEVDTSRAGLTIVEGVEIEGPFTSHYVGSSHGRGDRDLGDCSKLYETVFYKPVGPGPFPLFIYTVGTTRDHDWEMAIDHLQRMAARGFVAISADYDNLDLRNQGCTFYPPKAYCIYAEEHWGSVVNAASFLPYVDAHRVVTAGHSQGGHLALLAGNHNDDILAAHPTGVTATDTCLTDLALPAERMRIGNGEHEDRHGCGSLSGFLLGGEFYNCRYELLACNRPKVEALAGDLACGPGATECFREDGSGWFFALDEQVDPCAAHGYRRAEWAETDAPWGREANLDWLAARAR